MCLEQIDEYAVYQFFCEIETQIVSKIITDSDLLKTHLESLWYDLKKYDHQDIYVYRICKNNKIKVSKKLNYFTRFLRYFRI
jgi:hypothetical protein